MFASTPFSVFLNQLKEVVTERTTKISMAREEAKPGVKPEEIVEPEDVGLGLKSLSITYTSEQKCVETFVRLNSINVELIGDELDFIRYVIDFAIDYATNNIVDSGKMGDLRIKLALMLNISETDDRFIAAMEIIDKLIEDVAGEDETDQDENDGETETAAPPAENGTPSDEEVVADEFFYDPSNPKKVHIPPVWTPTNKRANAALIYLYFRVVSVGAQY